MSTRCRTRAGAAALLAVLVAVVAAQLLGVRCTTVLTGSMSPAVPRGALVVTVPTRAVRLRPGRLAVFVPPPPYTTPGGRPVLHRVAAVTDQDGRPVASTRGDANPAVDPWRLDLAGSGRYGRPVLVVPRVGWLLAGGPRSLLLVLAGGLLLLLPVRGRSRAVSRAAPAGSGASPR